MRRIAVLLGLALVLSGPLLRESEAAGDYVRIHSARRILVGVLTEPDGGVGDDSGDATLKADDSLGGRDFAIGSPWDLPTAIDTLQILFRKSPILPDPANQSRQPGRATPLFDTSHRRLAWLQLFLL